MSFYINRENESIGGHNFTQELMESQSNGKLYFRSPFERNGFNCADFASQRELLEYLDSKIPENNFLVYGDEILYALSEGDRTLCYFGTIKEEGE